MLRPSPHHGTLLLQHDDDDDNDIIIVKLYCHFPQALHIKLECSLALTHVMHIYTIK